jgi:hydrogenase maturation protease
VKILVAGIGNIFFADDGFGVEVAQRMSQTTMPDGVKVVDYGIRGMHLAYDMLAGYDVTILVDAVPRGDAPGTVYVIDVTAAGTDALKPPRQLDPHGMTPDAVLDLLGTLGGDPGQVYVVGCEPASTDEEMGLSPAVSGAIDTAIGAVMALVQESHVENVKGTR